MARDSRIVLETVPFDVPISTPISISKPIFESTGIEERNSGLFGCVTLIFGEGDYEGRRVRREGRRGRRLRVKSQVEV